MAVREFLTDTLKAADSLGRCVKPQAIASETAPYIRVSNLKKSFGHVKALDGVDIEVYLSQVLAIVGDNGAGKSTLIKILSGVYPPDSGEIQVGSRVFHHLTPALSISLGVTTVYQDLALVDCRDVASNVFLGREPTRRIFIDKKKMKILTERLIRDLNISIPSVLTPVGLLSGGQRQGVAIARALNAGGKILILDEPTAAMGVEQSRQVLDLILTLRDKGYGIVLISHNLHQVFQIADRVCVLRHGRVATDIFTAETNPDAVVRWITGIQQNERG